ncbi:hypothetical protein B0H14DRAFT_2658627 [Mycena olivaceomarginata]|nr:hypothetical protein B0H14DRAFT_2658627 [Mycena olivaceomarginata]
MDRIQCHEEMERRDPSSWDPKSTCSTSMEGPQLMDQHVQHPNHGQGDRSSSLLHTRPSSRDSEEKAAKRTLLRRFCTQDHRAGTRKRKQLRELFFVVPAHKTIEQGLGRESSRENRSSSFLHTRPSSRDSEEKAVERTVLRRSCTQDHRAGNQKRKQSREPFFIFPAHKPIEQKLGREHSPIEQMLGTEWYAKPNVSGDSRARWSDGPTWNQCWISAVERNAATEHPRNNREDFQ